MSLSAKESAKALINGKVLAYPTEGVWGLGCDPFNQLAFEHVLRLKARDPNKGVIVLFASLEQLRPYLLNNEDADKITVSERATTYLVNIKAGSIPSWITGKHPKLAVRICRHPNVQNIIQASGQPLVSTSLNPNGRQPARFQFQVWRYFRQALEANSLLLSQGSIGQDTRPSRIIDLESQTVLRD